MSIYSSGWNSFYTDNNKNSFRQKVSFKCTLKAKPMNNGNKGDKFKIVLASIKRLLSLIPTKSFKEVKEIFKYFKNLKIPSVNKSLPKLYAQVLKQISYTEEVLKIKNIFLSLKVSKIDNIQKIIKGAINPNHALI